MKKWISMMLCILAVAASIGCGKTDQPAAPGAAASVDIQPVASGRYVEDEIDLPLPEGVSRQMILGVCRLSGALTAFTAAYFEEGDAWGFRYYRHTLAADGTVATADETWLNELAPLGGNEMHVSSAPDGTLYMYFSDYDEHDRQQAHVLVSRDNGASGTALTGGGVAAMGTITSLGVLADGSLATANFYDGSLLLLDSSGNRITDLTSGNRGQVSACAADGGSVAFAAAGIGAVSVYRQAEQTYADFPFAFSEHSAPQLAMSPDGAVFLADSTGLYRHAADGTIWEQLVDGSTSTLGLPNFYAAFLTAEEGGAYPTLYVSDLSRLLVYRFDPAAVASADKELTVFSLTDNDTVRQAIVAFSRQRPDVRVTYTVAMAGASGGTEQDYIKALNTELLAGTGPDILILDGLPIDSYMEKDVLLDLSDAVAGAEAGLANILSAYESDGRLYAVPTGFTLPLAVSPKGTETAFSSLSALADAAEHADGLPLLSNCAFSFKTLSLYLIKYYGGALMTGDTASATAFLQDARRIAAATGCTARMGDGWDALKDVPQDEMYEDFHVYISSPQVFACASGLAQAVITHPLGSVADCMQTLGLADRQSLSAVSINDQYVPTGVAGVNKASAEQEAATAFVQALLSFDAQGGNQYGYQFPVNEQALSEMFAYENEGAGSGFMLNDGTDFMVEWPSAAQREKLGALIRTLNKPITEDAALTDMLLPAVEGCLDGSSTVGQAADTIVSLLSTYLSE